jgi:branched-chain amino acid transport system permease protein
MVDSGQHELRKRDLLYVVPLWLLSLILPDPHLDYRQEARFRRRELFYLGAFLLFPLIWPNPHIHYVMVLAGIYAILALGLSLFLGYTGQISLGHSAFFGAGAYTTAILTARYGFPPFVAFWASAIVAATLSYLIGRPILKLKGYFLALATLGFGEIFLVVVREAQQLTGGVIGIFGIPWFSLAGFSFDTYFKQYYLVWGVLLGLVLFSKNLIRSKMGRAFLAVAASEDAASTVGIKVAQIKLGAFVIGAAFAGFGGSLFACIMSTANPEAFGLRLSIIIIMMVILGGMGNLYGPIGGAIFLTWLLDILGKYQEYSMPIYALILILLLIIFPEGIGTRLNIRLLYLISYWGRRKRRERVEG